MKNTQRPNHFQLILSAATFGLAACTTMTEYNCKNSTDWFKIGRNAASVGELSDISNLQKTCPQKMTKENSDAYLRGYNEQIVNYCKPDSFQYLAQNNEWGKFGSCPKELQPELSKASRKGRDIADLNSRLKSIEYELESDTITDRDRENLEKESAEKKSALATLTE